MDELLEQFLIETRDLVTQAGKDLALLASIPDDRMAIDSVFRAIHTLKGSFAIFGLAAAEGLLHGAEDRLDQARKGTAGLNASTVKNLLACLDQTDRWIDEMESNQSLSGDAQQKGARLLALFDQEHTPSFAHSELPSRPEPASWVSTLLEREKSVIAAQQGSLVAFRYCPDPDCFFRGEDPLSVVETVPQLLALAMLPRDDSWPASDDLEPFSCFIVIEGLSAASESEIKAAFRLQPDQVETASVAGHDSPLASIEAMRETQLLRVEQARVDALVDGLRDLVVATNRIAPLAAEIEVAHRDLAARLRALDTDIKRITAGLGSHLTRIQQVPLAPALRRLPRAARDMAHTLGKEIDFTITGDGIEADKQIVDALFEPLLHLLRNAIDHGIERPDVRLACGKDAEGKVSLAVRRESDAIILAISDDGAGIDPARIRKIAVERGLLTHAESQSLDDQSALRIILRPGFSTAAEVTDLSGRGVGMDAVDMAIARLRGSIDIQSSSGLGTCFQLRLPAHALTTRLLVVTVGLDRFGLALDQVRETVRIDETAIRPAGSGQVLLLRNKAIPVLDLAELLNLPPHKGHPARFVITQLQGDMVALRIGNFAERLDTVLRAPRGILALSRGIMGSALMGDGSVLLVLDLPELMA
ncbi:chemotaxis protein CheA [Novosphingobium terrae]|uniref:chemotaxis protein CheA n=1 Tax=Novosphingobium terrae TaxID=2726189 RepID=UPI001980D0FF|nr:chemotaxis protein CheA [Novosphingobium terrae]